jgi:hypothetical protein
VDRGDAFVDAARQAVGGHLVLAAPPDLLDGVLDMPAVGRQSEQVEAGRFPQPGPDNRRRMDAGIVHDQQDWLAGIDEQEALQEGDERAGAGAG